MRNSGNTPNSGITRAIAVVLPGIIVALTGTGEGETRPEIVIKYLEGRSSASVDTDGTRVEALIYPGELAVFEFIRR